MAIGVTEQHGNHQPRRRIKTNFKQRAGVYKNEVGTGREYKKKSVGFKFFAIFSI
jgi:hypothetical protein